MSWRRRVGPFWRWRGACDDKNVQTTIHAIHTRCTHGKTPTWPNVHVPLRRFYYCAPITSAWEKVRPDPPPLYSKNTLGLACQHVACRNTRRPLGRFYSNHCHCYRQSLTSWANDWTDRGEYGLDWHTDNNFIKFNKYKYCVENSSKRVWKQISKARDPSVVIPAACKCASNRRRVIFR
jgi:hypothetical protein